MNEALSPILYGTGPGLTLRCIEAGISAVAVYKGSRSNVQCFVTATWRVPLPPFLAGWLGWGWSGSSSLFASCLIEGFHPVGVVTADKAGTFAAEVPFDSFEGLVRFSAAASAGIHDKSK